MTIYLTTSLTIGVGETYTGTSGAVFHLDQYPPNWSFQNYGTIHAIGRNVTGFYGWTARGEFLNAGLIRVDSTGGLSYGLVFDSWGPDILNTGRIEFNGMGAAVRSWSPDQVITNHGAIIATSLAGTTTGLWCKNGLNLVNTGQIIADGSGSVAVFVGELHGVRRIAPTVFVPCVFQNDGEIIARGSVDGPTHALLYTTQWGDNHATAPNIINNGVMRADRAIWWDEPGGSKKISEEWVANHGEMYGTVYLHDGNDRFISDGVYVGHLDMSYGDDVVDLSASSGAVTADLGWGADRFTAGADAAEVNGGAGDDQLFGGAGSDRLNGSADNDRVEGGGGDDLLEGQQGIDHLYGGDGDDVLIGDVTYEFTFQHSCDDFLSGGAGNDRLMGGAHNDTLDGGDGVDTAVYLGMRSDYRITIVDGVTTVMGRDGRDTLTNVERLEFFDGIYAPDGRLLTRYDDTSPGDDVFTGGNDTDRIRAGAGDDVITPGNGLDYIDGGAGSDVVWLNGKLSDYKIVSMGDDFLITAWHIDGKYLTNVETVRFFGGGVLDLARQFSPLSDPEPSVLPGLSWGKTEAAPLAPPIHDEAGLVAMNDPLAVERTPYPILNDMDLAWNTF